MKRILISIAAAALCMGMMAQTVRVSEPDFVNSYIHLTSDSTFKKLPKETGQFKKHESKASKWAKIGGAAASVAGTVGFGVAAGSGSVGGLVAGLHTMNAATGVASAAGTLDLLAGFEGMDIAFNGKNSPYAVPAGQDIRIIYRAESNDTDPADFLRVVKFKSGKKDRKIQWKTYDYSLLGGDESRSNGFLPFEAVKFGESSYLITIPGQYLAEGEYGIVSPSMSEATIIPIATFGVK